MSAKVGSEPLGKFYTGKKAKKRREWRGIRDTWYDYCKWLKTWKILICFMVKPNNLKGFLRYRWMMNYLAVPDFMDRHTEGLRGVQLRMVHEGLGLIVRDVCDMIGMIFKADPEIGNDTKLSSSIVLFDENMMSTLMGGFPNLRWLSVEVPSVYSSSMMAQDGVTYYVDTTHEYGVPADVCPMPAAELGVALADDFPKIGCCMVHCNTTCDGSLMGNSVMSQCFDLPSFELAVPIRHLQDSVQEYAKDEILSAIHFIEEQTGETFDWDAYFDSMKRFNLETKELLEWLDISKTDYPQFYGVGLALYRYGVYQAAGGRNQTFLDTDRRLTALAMKGYKEKWIPAKEIRHRAVTWGVQAAYYTAFPNWLQNCWGILPLVDMLSMVSMEMINTEDKEQSMYDLAYLYENMIMRNRSNGGYETGVEALWRICEMFHADMVIMYEHIGCKSMAGYHGLFDEEARKHGIHLIWVHHNLMCPLDGTRRDMRTEVNRYMRSVLREEPIDPTLEDFDDSRSW